MRAIAHQLLVVSAATSVTMAQAVEVALPRSIASPEALAYDIFGCDLAVLSDAELAIGMRGADQTAVNAGAVELFERSAKGWVFRERLAAPGVAAGDQLGEVVAGSAPWLFASATRNDAAGADAGAVWIYRRDGGAWSHAQTVVPSPAAAGARFGSAIAHEGTLLAIGAPAAGGGVVHLFELVGANWTATATIANPAGNPFNRFGDALAISGGRLFVGDPTDDVGAYDAGAVFVFERSGSAWTLAAQLRAPAPAVRENFGQAIAVDGARIAVGVPGAAAGAAVASAGRVDLYAAGAAGFTHAGALLPTEADAVEGGNFGWELGLGGGLLVVGAPGDAVAADGGAVARAGRLRVYRQADGGGAWSASLGIRLEGAAANEVLGTSVSFAGGVLAVGAPGAVLSGGVKGAAIAFRLDADCDGDGVPDELEIIGGAGDCDGDGVPDACEADDDGDGVPDACECPYDLDGDGKIGATDLAIMLGAWGPVGKQTPAGVDFNGDGEVDARDLTVILGFWGSCG